MLTLLLFFLFISAQNETATDSTIVKTSIENVTVFQSQAQIERTATVTLKKGKNLIVFTDLSESMVTNSIQLKGKGSFTLLSIANRNNFYEGTSNSVLVNRLTDERDSLQSVTNSFASRISVINSSINLLKSSTNIANNHKLTAAELDALLNLNSKRLFEFEEKKLTLGAQISTLGNKIRLLNNRIRESGAVTRNKFKEVIAEIEVESSKKMEFSLQYLVYNAGWNPSYDIRAENTNTPLNLTFKANIYQNTGYDWNDVNFTINSGDPSQNVQKPELIPTYLNFYSNITQNSAKRTSSANLMRTSNRGEIRGLVIDKETGETIPGATVVIQPLNRGVATDRDGNFVLKNISNGNYKILVSFVGFLSYEGEINIDNSGFIAQVALATSFTGLDELVVSGYAVTESNEDLSNNIRVRGNGSVRAVSEPLYIVDGEISPNYSLNELPPEKIESIEVIKDAEAVSLYGSQAAGGVVIITTKGNFGATLRNQEISNQTSFSYKIERSYSVPSDGKEHVLEIKKETPQTNFLYASVPKLSANAYLVGNLTDWDELNLIEGNANVYFENSFVGSTYLNPSSLLDTLEISLGKDERIIIERKKLKDFEERRFFGSKTRESLSFEISIRNTKSEPIQILVEDQIPVSTDESIKVSEKELSGGKLNEETGIIRWRLNLAPNETKKLKLNFQIEYPKGKRINY
ncbi:MAG: mucoidy inhibitor MuiA family protein [Balneola sp.]